MFSAVLESKNLTNGKSNFLEKNCWNIRYIGGLGIFEQQP